MYVEKSESIAILLMAPAKVLYCVTCLLMTSSLFTHTGKYTCGQVQSCTAYYIAAYKYNVPIC